MSWKAWTISFEFPQTGDKRDGVQKRASRKLAGLERQVGLWEAISELGIDSGRITAHRKESVAVEWDFDTVEVRGVRSIGPVALTPALWPGWGYGV